MKGGRNVVLCGKSLWYLTLPFVMESAFAETTSFFRAPEAVTTAKWRDVLDREQFSSQIGMKHTVSHPYLLQLSFCHYYPRAQASRVM